MKKIFLHVSGLLMLLTVLFLSSCTELDVVGREGLRSYEVITEQLGSIDAEGNLILLSPAGTEKFIIAADFSQTDNDLVVEFDVTDFYQAGFDPYSIDKNSFSPGIVLFNSAAGTLKISYNVSDKPPVNKKSPAASFIKQHPERLGYHSQFDHYGFEPGMGVMVEWADNIKSNDKDLVFVLDPAPFISAGLDTAKLNDWIYTDVTVMDKKTNKPVEVFKLLRVYDIN